MNVRGTLHFEQQLFRAVKNRNLSTYVIAVKIPNYIFEVIILRKFMDFVIPRTYYINGTCTLGN